MEARENKQKHILFIAQVFYPEVFRSNDLAAELVKRGYKVTVLTGIPNYPEGEFFEGYDCKHNLTEEWNGITILRIPVVPRGHNSLQLMRNYHSFAASGKKWVRKHNIDADLVFTFETSPMSQALIGAWYGKRYRVPVFLYAQDLWPENVIAVTGIRNRLVVGAINKMVDYIYKWTDEILVTSPSFAEDIVNRKVPVPRKKVHYWPQYAEEFYRQVDVDEVLEETKTSQYIKTLAETKELKIAFTGNLGMAQGLDVLPKTASLLKDYPVKFVIVGDGRYKETFLGEIKSARAEDKFILIPRQQAEKIPDILALCDAGFISFAPIPLWEHTIPAKLQSYMACGKTILASAKGETERIVREANCGFTAQTGNPEALADIINVLFEMEPKERKDYLNTLGENAAKYFDDHFTKKKLMDELEVKLEQYLAKRTDK